MSVQCNTNLFVEPMARLTPTTAMPGEVFAVVCHVPCFLLSIVCCFTFVCRMLVVCHAFSNVMTM